jgi:predicted ATPase
LSWRSWPAWCLGYPEAALRDADHALGGARKLGHAGTSLVALACATHPNLLCGHYATANTLLDEFVALADEKGAAWWKAVGIQLRGWLFSLTGKPAEAVELIASGTTATGATGATSFVPARSSDLARAYADLGRLEDARRCIDDAMSAIERTKDQWWEAEVHRVAGEIALKSREPGAAKALFERALSVARQQQAKSWELRAAMSLARLWRDQGKPQQARELLAPVYGWFTEGFDTRDLKEAKALLGELRA